MSLLSRFKDRMADAVTKPAPAMPVVPPITDDTADIEREYETLRDTNARLAWLQSQAKAKIQGANRDVPKH